jgi:hypothetical protein
VCKQLGETVILIFSNFCSLQIKEDEMGEVCGKHGEKRIAYRVLVRKSEGQKSLGQRVFRTENNIGGSKEIWCKEMVWLYLAQDTNNWRTVLKMTMNSRRP